MSQQVTAGQMVTLTCNAMAFPAPSYSWSTPNTNDFNTSTISFIASYSSFGNYTCMATSNGTVVESQPALLTGNYVMSTYVYVITSMIALNCMDQWSKLRLPKKIVIVKITV